MILIGNDKDNITTLLLRISCILSILGSTIVMTACRFPETMRQKKGRQLIFWLSFSDFGTSIVYFLSTFEHSNHNTSLCKSLALLGIFFPIASFFWTDYIAWHIYITIAERKIKTTKEWISLMRIFHILAWGCGTVCILIIGIFDHAGRGGENTGGWCWVEASEKTLIYWELIGGKFIEWTSCFIWLPLMYLLTIRTLYLLERSDRAVRTLSSSRADSSRTSSGIIPPPDETTLLGNKRFRTFYFKMVIFSSEHSLPLSVSVPLSVSLFLCPSLCLSLCFSVSLSLSLSVQALVPVIFFLIRIWGTLRIFLYLFSSSDSEADRVADSSLFYLQAIFDPSQGLFNAIIFVFLSSKDRANLKIFLTTSYLYHQLISGGRSLLGVASQEEGVEGDPVVVVPGTLQDSRYVRDMVTNPLTGASRRFYIQEDTIVEMSSHMASGAESEMTGRYESRESDETTRRPSAASASVSRIVRDSFSLPSLNDEC
jgi:hypothetical protein